MVLNYNSAIADYDYIINSANFKAQSHFPYFNRAYVRFKMVEMMQGFQQEDLPENLVLNTRMTSSSSSVKKDNTAEENKKQQSVDFELIEKDLLKVMEIDPNFEFAYYNLGILKCVQKDFEAALQLFNKAIELNPYFSEAYFNRGLTHIYLNEDEKGTMDLSKAGELGLYKAYNVIKRYGKQKKEAQEE